jgi:hypothetical protein
MTSEGVHLHDYTDHTFKQAPFELSSTIFPHQSTSLCEALRPLVISIVRHLQQIVVCSCGESGNKQ